MNQKKAVIYCRVSSPKQADKENLETQEEVCKAFACGRVYQVVAVFKEPWSGRDDNRPQWIELMKFCAERKDITAVIIKDIDRLTRGGSFSYANYQKALQQYGIDLIDVAGIIQDSRNTLEHTGFSYSWSVHRPSESSEVLQAERSKEEVRLILTRTIGKQIKLTQQGYWCKPAPYGFKTEKILDEDGKYRTILLPNGKNNEAHLMKTMFEMRANSYPDEIIVKNVNKMGFETRERNKRDKITKKIIAKIGKKKLTVKALQKYVKNLIFCGVIKQKWTHALPIKAKFKGLIDYETFNKANKGKIFVEEKNEVISVIYNKNQIKSGKRQKYNPLFTFKGVILCNKCKKPFLASSPKGKSGKGFPTYHCGRKHKYFGIPKKTLENNVELFLKGLKLSPSYSNLFKEILKDVWFKKLKDIKQQSIDSGKTVEDLKRGQKNLIEKIEELHDEKLIQMFEEKYTLLSEKIESAKNQRNGHELKELETETFIKYAFHFMEHLDELLIDNKNPQNQQALFSLIFEEFPTYEEILNGTPKLTEVFEMFHESKLSKSHLVAPRGIEPLLPG